MEEEKCKPQVKFFANEEEMDDYMKHKNYAFDADRQGLCFGINIAELDSGKYDYTLRVNLTNRRSEFPSTGDEEGRVLLTEREGELWPQG
jgi:hypothetical protein